jgi:hypothetical protein
MTVIRNPRISTIEKIYSCIINSKVPISKNYIQRMTAIEWNSLSCGLNYLLSQNRIKIINGEKWHGKIKLKYLVKN